MVVGRVVKFDQVRGYGFIAQPAGGEDIFLHVNDLQMLESEVRPGAAVEFDIDEGGRGLKASNIRLVEAVAAAPIRPARPAAPAEAPGAAASADAADNEGDLCDVLTPAEFTAQVTELMISASPTVTGAQVLELRKRLLGFCVERGWVAA